MRIYHCLFLLFLTANAAPDDQLYDMRINGCIAAGLLLIGSGAYQIVKNSEDKIKSFLHSLSGLTFITAGLVLILISAQIANEIDTVFSAA